MARRAWSMLLVLLSAYAAAILLLFVFQRQMIYFPGATRVDAAATDFSLERDGVVLRGWIVNPGKPAPILYFGGNAEAIEHNRDDFARWFPGRSVYLLAYRGYGASDGRPSEAALLGDALALFDDVRARHPGQPVAVIGRSLGSGVASHVASRRPVDRLALITPFDSLADVAQAHFPWLPARWLVRDRFPSTEFLRDFHDPVLILAAGRDRVVPPANTEALIRALPEPPKVVVIDAADHNDIHLFPEFGEALATFLR